MALLFAEKGLDVFITDRSPQMLKNATQKARNAKLESRVHPCEGLESMCTQMGSPKAFLFSLPHGKPGDGVVEQLRPYLEEGDIVIDASNENYQVTQKRQASLRPQGVAYIGMGVSGGFSGARHGPSMMPGGDAWAVDRLLPLLKQIAAKDEEGRPCVTNIGSGGSGHYVKMVHNGIEHGIMSALCEAWEIMDHCLEMESTEIGAVFDSWLQTPQLVSFVLVLFYVLWSLILIL